MAAQLWSMDTWYKALLRRLTNCEGSGQATGRSRGFAFCLKSKLLSNTVRSRGRERLCGHDVMDDLMVPAHRGKEGRTERGPSSISHKVSVGSASKPRREKRFGHSKGQEEKVTCRRKKTRHIQGTFSGRVTYTSPNVWPCHQGGSVATRRISPII